MATIMGDRERVEQLRRRLGKWNPDEACKVHSGEKCVVYDPKWNVLKLHLCGLGLKQIPSEIWQFSALQFLYLRDNQLSSLPPELGNLSSLQGLYLHGNHLSSLPPELGNLSSLQKLSLDGNHLRSLPSELGNLSALQELYLHSNPLQIPPSHIIGQGIPAILAYLRRAALDTYLISQSLPPYAQAGQTIRVLYLYAQADIKFREELEKHVSGLRLQRLIIEQHEGQVPAGEEREQMVRSYLDRAEIVLLLVSPDFMASEFMASEDREVQWVMQRHAKGEIRVISILLRPVDYTGTPFASLAHFPSTGEPITRWMNRDDAFLNIVQGLRTVLQEILDARSQGVQQKLEGLHGQIDRLRDPYTEVEGSLKSLSDEEEDLGRQCRTVEEEIVALQRRLQGLRQEVANLPRRRQRIEEERQEMRHEALELRKQESILEQEAQDLMKQIEKVKQQ